MKLSEVFNQLSVGEFSQLRIGGNEEGVIDENNYSNVVNHVNLGLTTLYKRFNIKEGKFKLEVVPGRTTYPISAIYAKSNTKSKEPTKYIDDSEEKFSGELFKIERVVTDKGCELGLNDARDNLSIVTPSYSIIRLPKEYVGDQKVLPEYMRTQSFDVSYRANHKKIEVGLGYFDPERIELDLPDAYLQALLLWIASRVHAPVGMSSPEPIFSLSYYQRYENECQRLEQENLQVDLTVSNDRLIRGGWA